MSADFLVLAACVFLLSGAVKGLVGIGLPVAAVGILSQFTDARTAVLAAIFPIVVSNVWQVFRSGDVFGGIRRYWPFAATLALVLLVTTHFAPSVSATLLVLLIGIVIVAFAATNLAFKPPALPEKYDRAGQVFFGILAGISGGLTAIWGPAMVIYFLSRRLEKDEFVRASGILFLAGSIPLLVGYLRNGLITGDIAYLSALMIVPTLLGFALGEQLRKHLDASRFRTAVLVMFLLIGLNLLRRAIF
jgi:uncharacterized membrane protein YfcA